MPETATTSLYEKSGHINNVVYVLFYPSEKGGMYMEILENEINKKIISGCFPHDELLPDEDYSPNAFVYEEMAGKGLKILGQYPDLMYGLLMSYNKKIKEIESTDHPGLYVQEVNALINTGYSADDLGPMVTLYTESCNLCPAITSADKALWYGAFSNYFCNYLVPDDESFSICRDLAFTWIYLLKLVQNKEVRYGKTINFEAVSAKTNLLKLIEADWDKVDGKYFIKLTDYGLKKLVKVREAAKELGEKYQADINRQKEIAINTKQEWNLFLDVLNDLSRQEHDTISCINRAGSPKDKIGIISKYNNILRYIERGSYTINGEEISLLPLFENVNERMTQASVFCNVKTGNGKSFHLHPAALMLTMEPKTFNYLYISFHEFRLKPGKDAAKKFSTLALSMIKKNLGEQETNHDSIDDVIEEFYRTVMGFVKKHSKAIDRLSFEKLKEDTAVLAPELSASADNNGTSEDLAKRIKEFKNSDKCEKEIEKILTDGERMLTANEIATLVRTEEERSERIEQEVLASRIIASLNIIYMFCDALRIMLTNRHANIKLKNRETVENHRKALLTIDEKLIHKVYANLGEQEMGMLEYREKKGIIPTSLSEQEMEEENYRNSLFGDVLKNSISSLIESIDKKNADDILKIKSQVRLSILRYPDCDEKERYTVWLDSISEQLSEVLVAQCKKENDYQKIKEGIVSGIGEKARILPSSTVDSLTTAEMLFAQYASEEYAKKGFDFSCISALYYQAFEEAYNVLMWRGYADELNALEINGQKFTDILNACKQRGIGLHDARGYLDPDPRQRGYYVDYQNANRPDTNVSERCMYKSFAILLQNVKPGSVLNHFCEYIAKICGFGSSNDMFNDSDFMRNFYAFTSAVDASADNRNNASHGGTFISVAQCKSDKKTVLSELEAVRSDSIGLVQQLLYLLKLNENDS